MYDKSPEIYPIAITKLYEMMSKTYEKFAGLGPVVAKYEYL